MKSLVDPVKKSNIKTNTEEKKTPNKLISVLMEDKQVIDLIAGKPTNLNEASHILVFIK